MIPRFLKVWDLPVDEASEELPGGILAPVESVEESTKFWAGWRLSYRLVDPHKDGREKAQRITRKLTFLQPAVQA